MKGLRSKVLHRLAFTIESSGAPPDWLRCIDELLSLAPLDGNPGELHGFAARLRNQGGTVDQVRADTDTVRRDKLPQIWTGFAAASAGNALGALVTRIGDMTEVFYGTSSILDTLGNQLEAAHQRDQRAWGDFEAARRLQNLVPVSEYNQIRAALVGAVSEMATAAVEVESAAANAAQQLRSIANRATAAKLASLPLTPVDRLVLSATADGAGRIISTADAARASAAMNSWPYADRQRFNDLLTAAQSDAEKAWLLKAAAAGHTLDQVAEFDATIRPHANDPAWLMDHLRPINPVTGVAELGGAQLKQSQDTTCGSMVVIVNHAMRDPIYALDLSSPTPPQTMVDRLNAEESTVHKETNDGPAMLNWPQGLGTPPGGVVTYLNNHSGGATYGLVQWDMLSITDNYDRLGGAITSAEAGNPSVLLVGGDTYPDHYLLVVDNTSAGTMVYNPADGKVYTVQPGQLQQADLTGYADQSKVWAAITPNWQP